MEGILGTGIARVAGFATGLAVVAAVALLQWRVAPSTHPLGLDATVEAAPSGAVAVDPEGPVVRSRTLLPGAELKGEMRVHNQTGRRLAAWPRLADGSRAVDSLVQLQIERDGHPVFRGPVAQLRPGAGNPIVLHPDESATVAVKVSLPEGTEKASIARRATWRLSFEERAR